MDYTALFFLAMAVAISVSTVSGGGDPTKRVIKIDAFKGLRRLFMNGGLFGKRLDVGE